MCPECRSTDLDLNIGFGMFKCRDCKYLGHLRELLENDK